MADEIIFEQQDPIIVEIINNPTITEIEPETSTEIVIAESDEALTFHMLQSGLGGHIPVNGISQNLIIGLNEKLLEMQSLIDEASIVKNPFLTNSITDLNSLNYYYYGGNLNNGQWQINRFTKNGLIKTKATQLANSAYTTFAEAWEVRSDLIYIVG